MERLFSPCTRLHDALERESQGSLEYLEGLDPEPLQELNLDLSTEELLSAERAFTFADLCAMLGNGDTLAWLSPRAAIARADGRAIRYWLHLDDDASFRFCFSADGKDLIAFARYREHLLEICDIVVRLFAVSVVHSVHAYTHGNDNISINAPTLAYLMDQCQSLKILSLKNLEMDEDHIRVLDAYSRPGLEIALGCTITSAGASALAEVLGHNQGPIKLDSCYIDNVVLADGLRGNSRLKSLKLCLSGDLEVRNRQVIAIAGALRENKGLVDLFITHFFTMSDEAWGVICDSLDTHPTIEVLDLRTTGGMETLAPAVLKSRIQALVDMMKVNVSIRTISVHEDYSQHEFFRRSVVPYLEANKLRPRVLAIQQTRPIAYRAKVLGRALLAVRTDPNRFWMLLSENAEVVFA
jgi:hypothetical protein